ncbi:glycosyltransferase family 2 protein [Clostridium paraputrificum]|uniref:glycosyltransferase family 2 protein n=1 Tax=Clostridium paraputrificum TaxID=29363 RepID=UPI00189B391B|nr:glycosyltransferase family 2 protein [Clostridium paraputrificum]MDB2111176.1 glycosyltransferase family 2 protein [Clostridium paraputrificum]
MNELISIVVPVYNVEKYLEECLDSICKQTYSNIEIILVNDGSTDSSIEICEKYSELDKRISVLNKENGGLSDARNCGIKFAKGQYLIFVDSDDIISRDMVSYLYNLIKNTNSEVGICDPVHWFPDQEIKFVEETVKKIFSSEDAIVEMLYQKSFLVSAWGKIYKKDLFTKITFPFGILFEDSAIMYRVFDSAKKIVYGNAKLYGYRHRENSITTKKFSKRDWDIIIICNEISEYFSNRSEELKKASASYQTAGALRIYMNAPRNGDFEEEIKCCKNTIDKNLNKVLKDKAIRKKMKIGLLIYKFARPFMTIVYRRVNRWK